MHRFSFINKKIEDRIKELGSVNVDVKLINNIKEHLESTDCSDILRDLLNSEEGTYGIMNTPQGGIWLSHDGTIDINCDENIPDLHCKLATYLNNSKKLDDIVKHLKFIDELTDWLINALLGDLGQSIRIDVDELSFYKGNVIKPENNEVFSVTIITKMDAKNVDVSRIYVELAEKIFKDTLNVEVEQRYIGGITGHELNHALELVIK